MSSQLAQLADCVWFSAVCVVSQEGAREYLGADHVPTEKWVELKEVYVK